MVASHRGSFVPADVQAIVDTNARLELLDGGGERPLDFPRLAAEEGKGECITPRSFIIKLWHS
jgi:hypothetical protein